MTSIKNNVFLLNSLSLTAFILCSNYVNAEGLIVKTKAPTKTSKFYTKANVKFGYNTTFYFGDMKKTIDNATGKKNELGHQVNASIGFDVFYKLSDKIHPFAGMAVEGNYLLNNEIIKDDKFNQYLNVHARLGTAFKISKNIAVRPYALVGFNLSEKDYIKHAYNNSETFESNAVFTDGIPDRTSRITRDDENITTETTRDNETTTPTVIKDTANNINGSPTVTSSTTTSQTIDYALVYALKQLFGTEKSYTAVENEMATMLANKTITSYQMFHYNSGATRYAGKTILVKNASNNGYNQLVNDVNRDADAVSSSSNYTNPFNTSYGTVAPFVATGANGTYQSTSTTYENGRPVTNTVYNSVPMKVYYYLNDAEVTNSYRTTFNNMMNEKTESQKQALINELNSYYNTRNLSSVLINGGKISSTTTTTNVSNEKEVDNNIVKDTEITKTITREKEEEITITIVNTNTITNTIRKKYVDDTSKEAELKIGLNAGAGIEMVIKNRFIIGAEYRFSEVKFTNTKVQTHNVGVKFGIEFL